jgi:SAM-dependent methyltransferase
LEDQHYPDASFDAVTLNHVIEHVPDPIQTLRECARILKKDGRLVILTPNSSSLGHRVFKQDWRGLEPPRHLHLFSMQSMRRTLELAGFRKVTLRPQIAFSVIYESVLLRQGQTGVFPPLRRFWAAWAFARLFNLVELCVIRWHPPVADCFGAIAEKEHTPA